MIENPSPHAPTLEAIVVAYRAEQLDSSAFAARRARAGRAHGFCAVWRFRHQGASHPRSRGVDAGRRPPHLMASEDPLLAPAADASLNAIFHRNEAARRTREDRRARGLAIR